MTRYLDRKSFVTKIGVAGLGLGLMVGAIGAAPIARAQDEGTASLPAVAAAPGMGEFGEKRAELYGEFTAALAAELGSASADEVDAAIRAAMMTVIDNQVSDDGLTAGQAEAMKLLVASSEAPLGPGPFFMGGHGPMGRGGGMGDHGSADGRMGPGQGDARGGMKGDDERGVASDDAQDDDYADANEAQQAPEASTPAP